MSESKNGLFSGFGRHRKLRAQICAERDRLYRIAWSWCHDASQADDLAQESVTRALYGVRSRSGSDVSALRGMEARMKYRSVAASSTSVFPGCA